MSAATVPWTCPACGVRGRVPASVLGQPVRCGKCQAVGTVALPAPATVEPEEEPEEEILEGIEERSASRPLFAANFWDQAWWSWLSCVVVTLIVLLTFESDWGREDSAIRQAARAGQTAVRILAFYVLARAAHEMCLRREQLKKRSGP